MQSTEKSTTSGTDKVCLAIQPSRTVTSLQEDVKFGLFHAPRSLPPKYFYDERGSQLFDRICTTPEYYPTRTEDRLLTEKAKDIISEARPDLLIELGSGTSKKTRRLFDASETLGHQFSYAPFDVCEPMLEFAAEELDARYDWLDTRPMLGDYHAGLANLPVATGTNLFIFLGSTIGNFNLVETNDFISDLRKRMSSGDYFLVGADRVKDISILNAAYNDAEGFTADFNLNVLRVLNRELGSNFDLDKFQHLSFFNEDASQIEMYLVALEKQEVIFDKLQTSIVLEQGERILTEVSRKFEYAEIESLFTASGFELVKHYEADNKYFSLLLVRAIN
jgi:L-histidine Nalpha-methyltransferase